jgi:hypothetical protein
MLMIDEKAAVAAIADLLPDGREARVSAFGHLQTVLAAGGDLADAGAERLAEIAEIFGVRGGALPAPPQNVASAAATERQRSRTTDAQASGEAAGAGGRRA